MTALAPAHERVNGNGQAAPRTRETASTTMAASFEHALNKIFESFSTEVSLGTTPWPTLRDKFLGPEGRMQELLRIAGGRTLVLQSPHYQRMQTMLTEVMQDQRGSKKHKTGEPTKVITVRVPKSVHNAIKEEAHDLRTSMNQLCICKILGLIDPEHVVTTK